MAPNKAFHIAQVLQIQPELPIAIVVRELPQPVSNVFVRGVAPPFVPLARWPALFAVHAGRVDTFGVPLCSWRCRAAQDGLTLSCQCLDDDLGLVRLFDVHLAKRVFPVSGCFIRDMVHTAILATPTEEIYRADTQISVNLRHRQAHFLSFARVHDLAGSELRLLRPEKLAL